MCHCSSCSQLLFFLVKYFQPSNSNNIFNDFGRRLIPLHWDLCKFESVKLKQSSVVTTSFDETTTKSCGDNVFFCNRARYAANTSSPVNENLQFFKSCLEIRYQSCSVVKPMTLIVFLRELGRTICWQMIFSCGRFASMRRPRFG